MPQEANGRSCPSRSFGYSLSRMHSDQNLGTSALAIGPVVASGRAALAPLSGVTDLAFRRIAKRFGAGLAISEMVALDDYVRGSEKARLRIQGHGISLHVVQLAGCEPRSMGEAALLAEASGAAIVDINMGCAAEPVSGAYARS